MSSVRPSVRGFVFAISTVRFSAGFHQTYIHETVMNYIVVRFWTQKVTAKVQFCGFAYTISPVCYGAS